MNPRWRRRLLAGGTFTLVVAVLAAPWAADRASRAFFVPKQDVKSLPSEQGIAWEELKIAAVDGTKLDAWRFPASPDPAHPMAIVTWAHGNYGNMTHQWKSPAAMAGEGFEVLLFDYRGFGNSPGVASRRSATEDVSAAVDAAQLRAAEFGGLPVVLLGQSMGGALAVEVAAQRHDLSAVALDSPFDSWPGIAFHHAGRGRWHAPFTWLGLHLLFAGAAADPVDMAGQLTSAPLIIVAGTEDTVCPAKCSLALVAEAGGDVRMVMIEGAKHVGRRTPEQDEAVRLDLAAFFREAALRR